MFNYQMVHRRYAKRFACTPPWGDCHAIWLLKEDDADEHPPPPAKPDPSSLKEQKDYPQEVARCARNSELHELKKLKENKKE